MKTLCLTFDAILSDMASERITVRVPATLGARIRECSRAKGQTPSDLVRIALESYLGKRGGKNSAYELAQATGLIGCAVRLPKDLTTNRRYFEGFGKGK